MNYAREAARGMANREKTEKSLKEAHRSFRMQGRSKP
jgi:hypothetical protein